MKIQDLKVFIDSLFLTRNNKEYSSQSGFNNLIKRDIKKIGYCTNLTEETVESAAKNKVDMLLTHHDSWDFLYDMKSVCKEMLSYYDIAHYFNHLPLDDCDFGTNSTLIKKLGLTETKKSHFFEGFYCGRIAKPHQLVSFNDLVKTLELLLDEPIRSWKFNDNLIERIGIVCGGGGATSDVKEAVDNNCDVYITSERNLYTLQYARLTKINLIICSHTTTEVFGVESLANKISSYDNSIEIYRIKEEYFEY